MKKLSKEEIAKVKRIAAESKATLDYWGDTLEPEVIAACLHNIQLAEELLEGNS